MERSWLAPEAAVHQTTRMTSREDFACAQLSEKPWTTLQVPMGLLLGFQQTPAKLAHVMNLISAQDDNKETKAGDVKFTTEGSAS